MSDNYPPSLLVMTEVRFLWHIANSFVQSISQLKTDEPKNIYSINILSSQAIELLIKSIVASCVCLENPSADENHIKRIIDERFRKLSHRLDDLINEVPDIKNKLNIDSIVRFNETGFVDEYRISFKNSKNILWFKTIEAARYGSFSGKKDVMTLCQTIETENFLTSLSSEATKKITEVSRTLQGYDRK